MSRLGYTGLYIARRKYGESVCFSDKASVVLSKDTVVITERDGTRYIFKGDEYEIVRNGDGIPYDRLSNQILTPSGRPEERGVGIEMEMARAIYFFGFMLLLILFVVVLKYGGKD